MSITPMPPRKKTWACRIGLHSWMEFGRMMPFVRCRVCGKTRTAG